MLKNRLGLRAQVDLEAFEALSFFLRSDEPLPFGRLSITHYRAVHHHLFQDVYGWAGRYRTVRVTKDRSTFCYPEHIDAQMRKLFDGLRANDFLRGLDAGAFARAGAEFLAELNAIHPFREGNGRTQVVFMALVAARAGHPMDLALIDPPAFLDAMIASFRGDEAPLTLQLRRLIAP